MGGGLTAPGVGEIVGAAAGAGVTVAPGAGEMVGAGVTVAPGEGEAAGDAGATAGGGAVLSPKMLGSPVSNSPAKQPNMIVAKVPTNKAFQPNWEISRRREGINAIVPPTKIPTEAR